MSFSIVIFGPSSFFYSGGNKPCIHTDLSFFSLAESLGFAFLLVFVGCFATPVDVQVTLTALAIVVSYSGFSVYVVLSRSASCGGGREGGGRIS